jgi:hypothetical protein
VTFQGAIFHQAADFSWCHIFDKAYFWRTHFLGKTSFRQSVIHPTEQSPRTSFIYPGEANFSWACFQDTADFYRTTFQGPVYLWRTVFCDYANFSETRFDSSAILEGTDHEVCLSRRDFPDPRLFPALLRQHLITFDPETEAPAEVRDYAHFVNVTSPRDLRKRLLDHEFSLEQSEVIESVYRK